MSEELFERYLRDELDDAGKRELSAILATEAGSRQFSDFVQEWTLLGGAARQRLADGDAHTSRRIRKVRVPPAPDAASRAWIGWAAGIAAAAVFFATVLAAPARLPRKEEKAPVALREPDPVPSPSPVPVPDSAPVPVSRPVPPPAPSPVPPPVVEAPAPAPAPPADPPREKPPESRVEPATKVARPVIAVVSRVQGDVHLFTPTGRRKAAAGDGLSADDGLESGGGAVIDYPDGTRLELASDSAFERLHDRQGRRGGALTRGSLTATVSKQAPGRSVVLTTAHAEITVVGTVLTVTSLPESTRVEVREGRVSVKRLPDGATTEVSAGHATIAAKGQKLESKPVVFTRDFQDGPGYAGTRDTEISGADPARTWGAADVLEVDGDEIEGKKIYGLLKWDLSDLPATAVVRSAVITLEITDESLGTGYSFYEMKRPWSEAEASWRLAAPGQPWRAAGARSSQDRGAEVLGTVAPRTKGPMKFMILPAGEAVLQAWIRTPASNHGFIIANDNNADGFKFHARESAAVERRPKLTITYTLSAK